MRERDRILEREVRWREIKINNQRYKTEFLH